MADHAGPVSPAPGLTLGEVLADVRPHEGGARVQVDATWLQGRTLFGGLIGALLLRAMEGSLGGPRPVRSLQVTFVGPVTSGEIELQVSILRAGSRVTHVQARLEQAGEIGAVAVGVFGAPRPGELFVEGLAAPAVPRPDGLARLPVGPPAPRFVEHFDMRWTTGGAPFSGAPGRTIGGWCRPAHAPGIVDAPMIVALVDVWPASVLPNLRQIAPASSVTWALDFAPGLGAADSRAWWQYEAHTEAAAEGYALSHAHLWDERGRLAAASRQMVAIFEPPLGHGGARTPTGSRS